MACKFLVLCATNFSKLFLKKRKFFSKTQQNARNKVFICCAEVHTIVLKLSSAYATYILLASVCINKLSIILSVIFCFGEQNYTGWKLVSSSTDVV